MARKAQTAVELLTMYSWVILILLIIIGIAYYSGYLNLVNWLPPYCNFMPTLSCNTFKFGYLDDGQTMALNFKITNGFGYDILIKPNATMLTVENVGKLGRNTYAGNCTSQSNPVREGDTLSCTIPIPDKDVIPTASRKNDFIVNFTYASCNAAPNYMSNGDCTGAPVYTVSGSIRAQLESNATRLHGCGDEVCDYGIGENPSNCCPDCPVGGLTVSAQSGDVLQQLQINATALYPGGMPAANATVNFTANVTGTFNPPSGSNTTNASGFTTASYMGGSTENVLMNVSACGQNKSVVVQIT
jgi:hypothetical protein